MKELTCSHTLGKTLPVVLALVSVAFLIPEMSAKDYSARTHYYAIEYLKPTAVGDVSTLDVTFNRQLDAQTAEKVLREELGRAVTLFPPEGDVMAYAWTQTDPTPGAEQMVSLPDDSHFLIYSPKTKQMLTEKQYDVSRQRPVQPGKGINIEISLEFERGADGRVRILGKTNLPHGMTLWVELRIAGSKYLSAQENVEVVDGRIVSPWFSDHGTPLQSGTMAEKRKDLADRLSDKGTPLRSGTYEIEMRSLPPDRQSQGVRAIIGETGENLLGPVSTSWGSKMVEYKTAKALK